MAKYEQDVRELLDAIGGKENIQAVSHCMTRMRFVLVDAKKADTKKIEGIPSVKGTFTQAGQFQVIIGNDVANFYKEFTAYAGVEGVSKEAAKSAAKSNQNPLQRIMGALGEIFAPLIPALIAGGLVLAFRNIIGEINFFENGTMSLADVSQFWDGMYNFLWLIGEAVFHLLPVGIIWSITKKMGTTQILGIVLGLTLVSSQLLNGFNVAGATEIPVWDFGFIQVEMIGYQGQVIAAMMAGFVLVGLEKLFRKICPQIISMIVVPFFSLVLAVIIAHTVVGPIGWWIGDGIANLVQMGLTSNVRWLFAAIFGLLYAPLVMTGLHHMTNAIDTTLANTTGGTILWPMIALSNIAQGSAVLAMSILQRKNKRAQQVNIPACVSCYLGVTEPALFGVNLKYGFPLVCGMVGSCVAAIISVGCGVEAYSIGVGGLPGILSIKPQFYLFFILAMVAAIVIPFLLTLLVGSRKLKKEDRGLVEAEGEVVADAALAEDNAQPAAAPAPAAVADDQPGVLKAPLSGKVIPYTEIPDQVFSEGVLGEGVGIDPTGSQVVAPADATVSSVIPDSCHAVGLQLDNGMELLIHVGIDTVSMHGDGFTLHVNEGDKVKLGDPLITFDAEKIRKAGHPAITTFLVSEPNGKSLEFETGMDAKEADTVVIRYQ